MSEQGSPLSDRGEGDRLRVREGFGIGEVVPDSFTAAVERQFRAEYERRKAVLRDALVDRLRGALLLNLQSQAGRFPGFRAESTTDPKLLSVDGVLDVDELARFAVQVFTAWVREGQVSRPASGPWASWGGDGVGP